MTTIQPTPNMGVDLRKGWECYLADEASIRRYWPNIRQMMEKVPHTMPNHSPESLFDMAINQLVQVWLVGPPEQITLVLISQVSTFPNARTLDVIWGAGENSLESGPIVDAMLDSFGRACGCERLDVPWARPGWEKIMAPYGFKKIAVVLSRPIHPRKDS